VRDQLSINTAAVAESERRQQQLLRRQLQAGLADLPAPKHEYTIIMPELPSESDASLDTHEVDAADVLAQQSAQRQSEEKARLMRRSQAIQRELPRPLIVNTGADAELRSHKDTVEGMVSVEMMALLKHDAAFHPLDGAPAPKKAPAPLHVFSDRQLNEARELVAQELKSSPPPSGAEAEALFAQLENQLAADSLYLPSLKQYGFASKAAKVRGLSFGTLCRVLSHRSVFVYVCARHRTMLCSLCSRSSAC